MSSIPSTIVRPLQDRGTPAGPKRSGIQLTPDLLPERVALQKGWHEIVDQVQAVVGTNKFYNYTKLGQHHNLNHHRRYDD